MYEPEYMKIFFKYIIDTKGTWHNWKLVDDAPQIAVETFNDFIESMKDAEKRGIEL